MANHPLILLADLPWKTTDPKQPGFALEQRFVKTSPGPVDETEFTLTNAYRDPATHTLMLQPAQLSKAAGGWAENAEGLFRRLVLADFTNDAGAVSENWLPHDYAFAGDTFLLSKTIGERLNTLKVWEANQAFFLRFWAYGKVGKRNELLEFEFGKEASDNEGVSGTAEPGWPTGGGSEVADGSCEWTEAGTSSGSEAIGLAYHVYSEGDSVRPTTDNTNGHKYRMSKQTHGAYKLTVYFDGRFTLSRLNSETSDFDEGFSDTLIPGTQGKRDRQSLSMKYTELMILPFRRNQILIWSSHGSVSLYTDEALSATTANGPSIDPGGDDFRITPPGHAAYKFPNSNGWIQLTPLVYHADEEGSGTAAPTNPPPLPYAPNSASFPVGQIVRTQTDWDVVSGTGVSLAHSLALDGTDTGIPWSMVLSGRVPDPAFPHQADKTPFVYGFLVDIPPGGAETEDNAASYTNLAKEFSIQYGEEGSEAELTIKDPRSVSERMMTALHRGFLAYADNDADGVDELFYGFLSEPSYDQQPISPDGHDHTSVTYKGTDYWEEFDVFLKNIRSLDGMYISRSTDQGDDALNKLLNVLGWPADRRDIDDLLIPLPADPRGEEKLTLADNIATGKDCILKLRDDYTTSYLPPHRWVCGIFPVQAGNDRRLMFQFKNPANLPDATAPTVSRTLYATSLQAAIAGQPQSVCIRTMNPRKIEPEANRIILIGEDANGNPIEREINDPYSQNPTLAEEDKPENWIGKIRPVTYYKPELNTPEQVNAGAYAYYRRLAAARYETGWTAGALTTDRPYDTHLLPDARRYTLLEVAFRFVLESASKIIRNGEYRGQSMIPPHGG